MQLFKDRAKVGLVGRLVLLVGQQHGEISKPQIAPTTDPIMSFQISLATISASRRIPGQASIVRLASGSIGFPDSAQRRSRFLAAAAPERSRLGTGRKSGSELDARDLPEHREIFAAGPAPLVDDR